MLIKSTTDPNTKHWRMSLTALASCFRESLALTSSEEGFTRAKGKRENINCKSFANDRREINGPALIRVCWTGCFCYWGNYSATSIFLGYEKFRRKGKDRGKLRVINPWLTLSIMLLTHAECLYNHKLIIIYTPITNWLSVSMLLTHPHHLAPMIPKFRSKLAKMTLKILKISANIVLLF